MDAPAQGGGAVEALVSLDAQLAKITQVVTQSEQIPDEVKADFQAAQQAFRSGLEKLSSIGDAPAAPAGGAVAPEAGASRGAVPMSPAGVRK